MADTDEITVIGGGIAGLVASIACAEGGAPVRLLEAHDQLGGRARTADGPYRTNFGPHALYLNGTLVPFLRERGLMPPVVSPAMSGLRYHRGGTVRRTPPAAFARAVVRMWPVREAPHDRSFRDWASDRVGADGADMLSRAAGVFTFHHDPGELSAAFVWERWRQSLLDQPSKARFPVGGWSAVVERLEAAARERGVRIETGVRVTEPPPAPAIVALELSDARTLLGDERLTWPSARALMLDLGLRTRSRPTDAWVIWDLDGSGWVERYTAKDTTLAPDGEQLVQAQIGMRPGESPEAAEERLGAVLDGGLRDWRDRVTFRRRSVFDGRSGALDLPGTSWQDRPAVDRGGGIFLAGDAVAAPGLLSDPSVTTALEAARGALAWAGVDAGATSASAAVASG
ncbi:NAD(P)-binding protein [Conexibacter stalactiti]|uniref:NAD(P)-binding protein n=1 Tax=Conexibacter stalactiti TaxID=1940611 RepID=A0ABU4HTL5_9ACTN|nr:NAD(P)-binding protein [Conexibacter stalactiti]MDW5596667.1 NAD(P)-binding protein [Conexibacter stalactiti]MEC5037309.1 NAD(P)-binding protein [Conexibacter stalactiti]